MTNICNVQNQIYLASQKGELATIDDWIPPRQATNFPLARAREPATSQSHSDSEAQQSLNRPTSVVGVATLPRVVDEDEMLFSFRARKLCRAQQAIAFGSLTENCSASSAFGVVVGLVVWLISLLLATTAIECEAAAKPRTPPQHLTFAMRMLSPLLCSGGDEAVGVWICEEVQFSSGAGAARGNADC